jgi:hypothetical protein
MFASNIENYQVKEDWMGGAHSANGGKRNAYGLLLGKSEKETILKT